MDPVTRSAVASRRSACIAALATPVSRATTVHRAAAATPGHDGAGAGSPAPGTDVRRTATTGTTARPAPAKALDTTAVETSDAVTRTRVTARQRSTPVTGTTASADEDGEHLPGRDGNGRADVGTQPLARRPRSALAAADLGLDRGHAGRHLVHLHADGVAEAARSGSRGSERGAAPAQFDLPVAGACPLNQCHRGRGRHGMTGPGPATGR